MANKPRNFPKLRRGEGSWRWNEKRRKVELRHIIGGKAYIEYGDTPAECESKREQRRAEVAAREEEAAEEGPASSATIADLVEHWLGFASTGKAPSTVKGFKRTAEVVIGALGDRVAATVTAGDLEMLLHSLIVDRSYRASTLAKRRTHLHMIFKHGAKHGYLKTNPVPDVDTPAVNVEERERVCLDEHEFPRMRSYLVANPSTVNTVFLLMLLTGLRPGEAIGVCWDALDLKRGTVEVRSAVQRQGGRTQRLVTKLKTPQSNRAVELPSDLLGALRRERTDQLERRLQAQAWVESPVVFTRDDGDLMLVSTLERSCTNVCKRAGTKRLTPNGFRHSNASMLLSLGTNPADVAKHLGHKDMAMLFKHYAHSMRKIIPTAAMFGGH